ncbi:Parvalbumin [Trema orientale]|uniref:Parvalbumin n=1 Tax=Trema orientale TaxID=63057 RepID=A0A2P5FY74_TREOI|nr:Parvalbumin [Trema orientale]
MPQLFRAGGRSMRGAAGRSSMRGGGRGRHGGSILRPPPPPRRRIQFDSDKDGKISREEFKSVLKDLDPEISDSKIAKAFQALDSDEDGYVDFKEFVQLFNMRSAAEANASAAETAFEMLNGLSGGGLIGTCVELYQVLKRLGMG